MSLADGVFFDTSTRGDVVSLGPLDQDRGIIAFRGRPMRLRALTKEMREEKEKAPGTKLSFCLGMGIFFPLVKRTKVTFLLCVFIILPIWYLSI